MKRSSRLGGALLLTVWFLLPLEAAAVTLGQIDTFQDGTTQNWTIGFPELGVGVPVNVPSGGPGGAGDAFLLLTSVGSASPNVGSRLTSFNETQWQGNYPAAGVNAVSLSVKNLAAFDLYLRLLVAVAPIAGFPPTDVAISKVPVVLPVGSGWTSVVFSLNADGLKATRGSAQTALANVQEFRIFHNPNAAFPPPVVAAQLGMDNIKAINLGCIPSCLPLLLLD